MLEEELLKRDKEPLEEFNINLKYLSKEIKKDNENMFIMFNIIIINKWILFI